MTSIRISGKFYDYYDEYYTKEDALVKALEIKYRNKLNGKKVRTYIQEVKKFGTPMELFLPTTKWLLWINGTETS